MGSLEPIFKSLLDGKESAPIVRGSSALCMLHVVGEYQVFARLPWWLRGKESVSVQEMQETRGSIRGPEGLCGGGCGNPLQPLPGKSHGQGSLKGYSPQSPQEPYRTEDAGAPAQLFATFRRHPERPRLLLSLAFTLTYAFQSNHMECCKTRKLL